MKKIYIVSVICLFYGMAQAQVLPEYNLYNANLVLLNPASVGNNGRMNAFLGHKSQWLSFRDAPKTTFFSLDGQLNKNMGLGLVANQQTMGLLNMLNLNINYAYKVFFADNHWLAIGTNFNLIQNKINTNGLTSVELADPALQSPKFNETLFSNAGGLSYQYDKLSVQLSSPLLYSYQEELFFQTSYMHISYDFFVGGGKWKIQPSTLLKYSPNSRFQADINVFTEWQGKVWNQLMFRTNKNFIIAAGVFIKQIGFGYAYEINTKPMMYASNGSHEVVLYYKLASKDALTE